MQTKEDISRAFGDLGLNVGPRKGANARTKEEKEWYCIRRYVSALAKHGTIDFPLAVEKGERPDFLFATGGKAIGIEVSEATDPRDQREMTMFEETGKTALLGSFGGRFKEGASGDSPELEHI